ncbi:hypothetical protein, partial [Cloacibacillus porcorum]
NLYIIVGTAHKENSGKRTRGSLPGKLLFLAQSVDGELSVLNRNSFSADNLRYFLHFRTIKDTLSIKIRLILCLSGCINV